MKNMKFRKPILASVGAAALAASSVLATDQVIVASATVLSDVQVTETKAFNFGSMMLVGSDKAAVDVSVTVAPNGVVTNSGANQGANAIVIVPPTPAEYEINVGIPGVTYTVTLPADTDLTEFTGTETRKIAVKNASAASLDPSNTFITDAAGVGRFAMGLTLETISVNSGDGLGNDPVPYLDGLYTGNVSVDVTL